MNDRLLVRIGTEPIETAEAMQFLADPASGGTCLFAGTVRDHSDAGEVTGLLYEAWQELALRRMNEIGDEMLDRWPARKAVLLHRFGDLGIGEVSVVVGCSAPHRDQAFESCRHGIERLKTDVPIWKKELLATGDSEWVAGS